MLRRSFFPLLPVLVLLAAPRLRGQEAPPAPAPAAAAKPNIVFIVADDWGRHSRFTFKHDVSKLSMNALALTPNFNEVCEGGVYFRNAHVSAPSCTPSRSAILTGRHFWRTGRGAILQGAVWDPALPAWPLLLRDAGYHIGKTGKVWSPGVPADAPFGGQAHAYEKAGTRFNSFSGEATRMIAAGKSPDDAKKELLGDVRANFKDFLAAREKGKPFCYWFGPANTHRPWMKGSGKALWNIDPDSFTARVPPFVPDVPEMREDLADYFGEIAAFDAMIGVLLEEVEKTGEGENTLFIISGDNGAPGFPKGKCNLYSFGTGVCLAIAGPGVRPGGAVTDMVSTIDLAPTVLEAAGVPLPEGMDGRSLWPSLASKKIGKTDPSRRFVITGRERHVADARAGDLPYPQRALRTEDYLFLINFAPDRSPLGDLRGFSGEAGLSESALTENTFVTLADEDAGPAKAWMVLHREDPVWKPWFVHAYGPRPAEELYDLRKDPNEMLNLAGDPAYAQLRLALRADLMAELRRTGDPRVVAEDDVFDKPPFAGPIPEDAKPPAK